MRALPTVFTFLVLLVFNVVTLPVDILVRLLAVLSDAED